MYMEKRQTDREVVVRKMTECVVICNVRQKDLAVTGRGFPRSKGMMSANKTLPMPVHSFYCNSRGYKNWIPSYKFIMF